MNRILGLALLVLLSGNQTMAQAEEACEIAHLAAARKYVTCLTRVQSKAIRHDGQADLARCDVLLERALTRGGCDPATSDAVARRLQAAVAFAPDAAAAARAEGAGAAAAIVPAFVHDLSPLRVQPGFGPVPYLASDGRVHLDYELYLTNRRPDAVVVTRVQVVDADDPANVIFELSGDDLDDFVTADLDKTVEGPTVAGAQGAIVYIDTSVADFAEVPAVLMHIVETENESGEPYPTIEGAFAAPLDLEPPVLGQPVSDGVWVAAEGCCFKSHHRRGPFTLNGQDFIAQRYAIDFIKLVDGKLWAGDDPKDLDAWYTYGEDALAVVDGTVSSVLTDENDITPFEPNPIPRNVDNITGNHVIIDMGNGLYVVYAHLQPGSIVVEVGDEVHVGDKLALVGNSGNTDAPHLHIHVMDANHVVQSHGVPFVFDGYTRLGSFESIDTFLPEPFGEVGPEEPDLLAVPEHIANAYPLELDIVEFDAGN